MSTHLCKQPIILYCRQAACFLSMFWYYAHMRGRLIPVLWYGYNISFVAYCVMHVESLRMRFLGQNSIVNSGVWVILRWVSRLYLLSKLADTCAAVLSADESTVPVIFYIIVIFSTTALLTFKRKQRLIYLILLGGISPSSSKRNSVKLGLFTTLCQQGGNHYCTSETFPKPIETSFGFVCQWNEPLMGMVGAVLWVDLASWRNHFRGTDSRL